MLINTKTEIHTDVVTEALEKQVVTHVGSINQVAANAPETDQDKRMQRRLRRAGRIQRNKPENLGLWRVSMW